MSKWPLSSEEDEQMNQQIRPELIASEILENYIVTYVDRQSAEERAVGAFELCVFIGRVLTGGRNTRSVRTTTSRLDEVFKSISRTYRLRLKSSIPTMEEQRRISSACSVADKWSQVRPKDFLRLIRKRHLKEQSSLPDIASGIVDLISQTDTGTYLVAFKDSYGNSEQYRISEYIPQHQRFLVGYTEERKPLRHDEQEHGR